MVGQVEAIDTVLCGQRTRHARQVSGHTKQTVQQHHGLWLLRLGQVITPVANIERRYFGILERSHKQNIKCAEQDVG